MSMYKRNSEEITSKTLRKRKLEKESSRIYLTGLKSYQRYRENQELYYLSKRTENK